VVQRCAVGYERALTPALLLHVRRARREVAARARGRILDLGGGLDHRSGYPAGADVRIIPIGGAGLAATAARGERFDTITSTFQIASAPDPAALVRLLAVLLAPDGDLLFVEPSRQFGPAGLAQRAAAPLLSVWTQVRPDRDIPALVRSGGLRVVDLDRVTVPTAHVPVRLVVRGRAHHAL
jgi:hypothetical protein